jgi:hypothetical protein
MDPAITTEQLRRQFGFESTFQYHDRHRDAFALIRAGEAHHPQHAAHGDRPMYAKWRSSAT